MARANDELEFVAWSVDMTELPTAECASRAVRVWEWPLRVWHWAFALSICASLATGLSGDIGLMDWHLRLGYSACGLLIFRLIWGFVGGTYSRWRNYRTMPGKFLEHFRGSVEPGAHTAPGIALSWFMLLAVSVQAVTGLFSSDDIFIDGPMVRHASDSAVAFMTAIHHRAFWLVLLAIAVHLSAHLVYALRRNPMPLAMFSGRKMLGESFPATSQLGFRGLLVGLISAALVWVALTLS